MSASSLVGTAKDNASVVDQGHDVDNTRADVMKPVTSIRLNDIDLDSDLVLSSDSDGLNGSELNVATTTEDEELRRIHPEIIELSVLRSSRSHTDRIHTGNQTGHHHHHHHHHQQHQQHPPNLQENHDRIAQEGSSAAISVESEIDLENEPITNQQSSDLPSERMFRPGDPFMRSHTAASTTIETTADTEDDLRMSSNKRTVKTKKKKVRRSSASETDTVDTTPHISANQRAHTGRRATRRSLDARYRSIDGAESHIIFAPFPFAIISDNNRIGKDNEQLRRAIALNNVIVSDECDDDEGGVDDDNWNEKEIDEDDDQGDDESVASTCTSIPATQQISSNTHPSSISSSSSSSVSMVTCRICFQPEEVDSMLYRLVSPCLCEGTIKYLHQFCLNRWIAESGTPSCELCGYQFHLRTSSMRNVLHWRLIELSQWERVHLSLGFFSLLFVVVSLSYMVWVTISSYPQAVHTRQSVTAEILFPIYACLDALTLCVCSYEMSSTVKRLWRRWRATNSCLIVLDKPVKRRRRDIVSVVLPERDSNRPSSSIDATATEESLAECVIEHAEDSTDDVHDSADSSSTKLLISSHVRCAPLQSVPDDCSVTLSIADHDPLTSCSSLAIAQDLFSCDKMYVEQHLNTETMV